MDDVVFKRRNSKDGSGVVCRIDYKRKKKNGQ